MGKREFLESYVLAAARGAGAGALNVEAAIGEALRAWDAIDRRINDLWVKSSERLPDIGVEVSTKEITHRNEHREMGRMRRTGIGWEIQTVMGWASAHFKPQLWLETSASGDKP